MVAQLLRLRADLLAGEIRGGARRSVLVVLGSLAGLVAAVFGGSHVQVSGPTGAMVVVLAPIVASHGPGAVVTVSVLAGVVVLVAGAVRLGRAVS